MKTYIYTPAILSIKIHKIPREIKIKKVGQVLHIIIIEEPKKKGGYT